MKKINLLAILLIINLLTNSVMALSVSPTVIPGLKLLHSFRSPLIFQEQALTPRPLVREYSLATPLCTSMIRFVSPPIFHTPDEGSVTQWRNQADRHSFDTPWYDDCFVSAYLLTYEHQAMGRLVRRGNIELYDDVILSYAFLRLMAQNLHLESDWLVHLMRIRQELIRDTLLHEAVERLLRQVSVGRRFYRIARKHNLTNVQAYHLVAQLMDDEGESEEQRDLDLSQRELAEELFNALPLNHPVRLSRTSRSLEHFWNEDQIIHRRLNDEINVERMGSLLSQLRSGLAAVGNLPATEQPQEAIDRFQAVLQVLELEYPEIMRLQPFVELIPRSDRLCETIPEDLSQLNRYCWDWQALAKAWYFVWFNSRQQSKGGWFFPWMDSLGIPRGERQDLFRGLVTDVLNEANKVTTVAVSMAPDHLQLSRAPVSAAQAYGWWLGRRLKQPELNVDFHLQRSGLFSRHDAQVLVRQSLAELVIQGGYDVLSEVWTLFFDALAFPDVVDPAIAISVDWLRTCFAKALRDIEEIDIPRPIAESAYVPFNLFNRPVHGVVESPGDPFSIMLLQTLLARNIGQFLRRAAEGRLLVVTEKIDPSSKATGSSPYLMDLVAKHFSIPRIYVSTYKDPDVLEAAAAIAKTDLSTMLGFLVLDAVNISRSLDWAIQVMSASGYSPELLRNGYDRVVGKDSETRQRQEEGIFAAIHAIMAQWTFISIEEYLKRDPRIATILMVSGKTNIFDLIGYDPKIPFQPEGSGGIKSFWQFDFLKQLSQMREERQLDRLTHDLDEAT